jgi:hypothetical protein
MKQTTEDDALIGLLSAVILQAVDDYRHLQKRGYITPNGEVLPYKFGRIRRTRSYHHCDGMTKDSEAFELKLFFTKWGLELLCDLTGHQACQIRRALGIRKEVA